MRQAGALLKLSELHYVKSEPLLCVSPSRQVSLLEGQVAAQDARLRQAGRRESELSATIQELRQQLSAAGVASSPTGAGQQLSPGSGPGKRGRLGGEEAERRAAEAEAKLAEAARKVADAERRMHELERSRDEFAQRADVLQVWAADLRGVGSCVKCVQLLVLPCSSHSQPCSPHLFGFTAQSRVRDSEAQVHQKEQEFASRIQDMAAASEDAQASAVAKQVCSKGSRGDVSGWESIGYETGSRTCGCWSLHTPCLMVMHEMWTLQEQHTCRVDKLPFTRTLFVCVCTSDVVTAGAAYTPC